MKVPKTLFWLSALIALLAAIAAGPGLFGRTEETPSPSRPCMGRACRSTAKACTTMTRP